MPKEVETEELDELDESVEKADKADKPVADKKPEDKPDWDKQRQALDQMKATIERIGEERDAALTEISEIQGEYEKRIAALEAKLVETKEKQQAFVLPEVDPASGDFTKQTQALHQKVVQQESELAALRAEMKSVKDKVSADEAKRQKDELIEAICKPLDEEFGRKYRPAAIKLADSWVDTGKRRQPKDALGAYLMARQAYMEVTKKPADQPKPPVTDSGTGKNVPNKKYDTLGEGTFDEVLAKMRKQGLATLSGGT